MPGSDRAQVEKAVSPAMVVIKIAVCSMRLFDSVCAGPEKVRPIRLPMQILRQVKPDLAPLRSLSTSSIKPKHFLFRLQPRQATHRLRAFIRPRACWEREI